MKQRFGRGAALLLAAATITFGLTMAAAAQEKISGDSDAAEVVTGTTIEMIVASFERNGFRVEVLEDSEGAPLVKSTDKGEPFSVYFYGCSEEGEDCGFIQFTTGWNLDNGITLAQIEEWNANKLWGVASRDSEKDPWLSMTVNLRYGVTVENFDDTVDWWRVILGQFAEHIGWTAE